MSYSFNRRLFLARTAGVSAGFFWGARLWSAQGYPARPVMLVVPYPAGGASDASARIFAQSISQSIKQQVVVENLGGGTGLIGASKVLNAPADGYTFFHGSANEVFLAPMLNPAAKYKPADFVLVSPITEAPIVVLAKNDLPVRSYDEFIDYAKQQKEPLSYATVGVDSMYHLLGDALAATQGMNILHVPYRGAAPAMQDVAGGQVDFAILPYQSAFDGMAKQGRLKILTSFSKTLPAAIQHIPLISASRYTPDFEYAIGGGYFVRRGTSEEPVAILRAAVGAALLDAEIRNKLELEGRYVHSPVRSQAEADAVFESQYQRFRSLIVDVGRQSLA